MTAVLLQSNKMGLTGWICLRRGNRLEVSGMEDGDGLYAYFKPRGRALSIAADGFFSFPPEAEHVRIEHRFLGARENGGGVNIDLVRVAV
jgi:hypothetical protein